MSVKLDDSQITELRRLWSGGALTPELARRFGISPLRVWHLCSPRTFGLPDRRSAGKAAATARPIARAARDAARRERDEEIRRLWLNGWTGVELASHFDIARSQVSAIVAGLPRPTRQSGGFVTAPIAPAPIAPTVAAVPAVMAWTVPIDPADRLIPLEPLRGSAHGRAKLTEGDVRAIRRLHRWGETYPRLARRFGISRSNVWYIVSGSTWSHVRAGIPAIGGAPC